MPNGQHFTYSHYKPGEQPLREALCTLGNGYFATRGAFEEKKADRKSHYPGTYLACGYNRLQSRIQDKMIENEDLVNWPNWLYMTFKPEQGSWLDPDQFGILDFDYTLDLYNGILNREMRVRDQQGHITHLRSQRIVSMHDPHLAGIQWTLTPENWSGNLHFYTEIDGAVINDGVPRYRDLNSHHLETLNNGLDENGALFLRSRTNQSGIQMVLHAKHTINGALINAEETVQDTDKIGVYYTLTCEAEQALTLEKLVSIFTDREKAISEPGLEAAKKLNRITGFETLKTNHETAWHSLWKKCNIHVASDETDDIDDQLILRFHIFHLLQTASLNSIDRDIDIPPRGWHGEAYRGHIFWDELFIFPFINLRIPQLTRDLLLYRFRRLEEARFNAQKEGLRGAMFPWQSGSNGREESQTLHLNPKSGRWIADNTHLQRHVNAAIAYNVWQYYEVTQDLEFLHFYGAEMLLSIMQCFSRLANYNEAKQRFEIRQVVGPDEYHTQYPDADQPGLNNNAYTNFLVAWVAGKALQTLDILNKERAYELRDFLGITKQELDRWQQISKNMFIPFHEVNIITQFEGYDELAELDWSHYRSLYGENFRLDRILESENDDTNRYKASKQADVLMLFYLFSSEEISRMMEQLGYNFDPATIPDNIRYYEERTSHGSSLSRLIHSWVTMRADREKSWKNYEKALISDVRDVQGGTTPEGIHLGAMAGTVDLMQRCYAGIEIRDNVLWLNPSLPQEIKKLNFNIRYRGNWICLTIYPKEMHLEATEGWNFPVYIGVNHKIFKFEKADSSTFLLGKAF